MSNNSITDIDRLYQEILGRAPDVGGAAHWAQTFGNTIDPTEIEIFRQAAAPELDARNAAPTPDTNVNRENRVPDGQDAGIPRSFYTSNEAPAAPTTVDQLYQQILGRAPEAEGLQYWQQQFGNTIDPTEVAQFRQGAAPELAARNAAASGSSAAATPSGLSSVSDLYQQVLGRAPEAEGLAYWQQQFGNTIDPTEIAQFRQSAAPELAITGYRPTSSALPSVVDTTSTSTLPVTQTSSTTLATQSEDPIVKLYQDVLGRTPSQAEIINWRGQFGDTVDANEEAIFEEAAGPELYGPDYNNADKPYIDYFRSITPDGDLTIGNFGRETALDLAYSGQLDQDAYTRVLQNSTNRSEIESILGLGQDILDRAPKKVDPSTLQFTGRAGARGIAVVDVGNGVTATYDSSGNLLDFRGEQVWPLVPDGQGGYRSALPRDTIVYSYWDANGKSNLTPLAARDESLAGFIGQFGALPDIALAIATGGTSVATQLASKAALDLARGATPAQVLQGGVASYLAAGIADYTGLSDAIKTIDNPLLRDTLTGATRGGLSAAVSGGDIGKGITVGAVSSAISNIGNQYLTDTSLTAVQRNALISSATAYAQSIASGQSNEAALKNAFMAGGKAAGTQFAKDLDKEYGITATLNQTLGLGSSTAKTGTEQSGDLSTTAFVDAKSLGATDQEAKAVADSVAGTTNTATNAETSVDTVLADLMQNNATTDRSQDVLVAGPMDAAVSRIDSTNTSQTNFEDTEFGDLEAAQRYAASRPVKALKFADAYDAARSLYGAGQVFTWNGKQYSTDSREENPSLAAASDALKLKAAADKTVATLSDPTIKDAVQPKTVTAAAKDYADAIYWNDDVVGDPFTGVVIKGGEMNRPDTVLGKAVTKFENATGKVVQAGLSNLAQALGEQGESFGSFLASIKVASPDNVLVRAGRAANDFGKEIESLESKQQLQNIINDVSKAEGVGNKFLTAVTSAWKNPTGAINAIVREGLQEVLPMGVVLKASKIIGLGAAVGLDTALNAAESMGGSYNQTYSEAIKTMSKENADALATQVAISAGGITLVTSRLVDAAVVKSIMREGAGTVGSQIAKGATKEGFAENIEETTTALATQYLTTGKIDLNNALTQGAVGHLFGKTTAGSVGTVDAAVNADQGVSSTASNVADQTGLGSIGQTTSGSVGAIDTAATTNQNVSSVTSNVDDFGGLGDIDTAAVTNQNVSSGISSVDDFGGLGSTGETVPANDLTNINVASDIQTQVASGLNSGQDVQTVVESIIQSAFDSGQNVSAAANNSIIASINNGVDAQSAVNAVNNSNTNVSASSNTDNGVTTITTADNNNNTQSTTTIDSNTNITATTTTDPNTNITTNNTTDNNNNVNINQNINSNNNTTTNTVTDLNTNIKVTIVTNTETGEVIRVDNPDNVEIKDDKIKIDDKVIDLGTGTVVSTPVTSTTTTPTTTTTARTATARAATPSTATQPIFGGLSDAGQAIGAMSFLGPQFLKTKENQKQFIDPLSLYRNVAAAEGNPMQQISPQITSDPLDRYYNYGKAESIDDILGLNKKDNESEDGSASQRAIDNLLNVPYAAKKGGLVPPLMAAGGSVKVQKYAQGGLSVPLMNHGGKMRGDFRHGAHVAGPGDGQSDDIPAMLADGEYVLDSEIVAALGNGSTKAGSKLLDKFRQEIRTHKRSGSINSIPPKSKSPLQYLSDAKKKLDKK